MRIRHHLEVAPINSPTGGSYAIIGDFILLQLHLNHHIEIRSICNRLPPSAAYYLPRLSKKETSWAVGAPKVTGLFL
jgi:hypothetical protein